MQKIQSYLYPNRIIVIADLAGFTVENTIVYTKNIKIYKGVDNVIQLDIQNADQKRLDLITSPPVTDIQMNVMDASGKALPNSPYTVTPLNTIKGIGVVTIPSADLNDLDVQFLHFSVTATDVNSNNIPLYVDSRFGAVGTLDLIGTATPVTRKEVIYDNFSGDINFMGNVTYHSSSIPVKFYEAVPTTTMTIAVNMSNFVGTLKFEGTEDMTISVESYKQPITVYPDQTYTTSLKGNGTTTYTITIGPDTLLNYVRVSWQYPDTWSYGATGQDPTTVYGLVNKITVSS
jgi:hypothetical protein